MNDTIATSSSTIASLKFNASAQEPEVINSTTDETSQAVRFVKPVIVYHSTTGQEYEVPDATIAFIESPRYLKGLSKNGISEGCYSLETYIKPSSLKEWTRTTPASSFAGPARIVT